VRRRAAGDRQRRPAGGAAKHDTGLARERTNLAWIRSSIAFVGLGVAILKFRPIAGILILAAALVLWLLGQAVRGRGRLPASRRALLVTVAITALALVSLVLTLAGPSPRGLHR
jgi:uncharacterized membrane protein YidH (DUF202 family)